MRLFVAIELDAEMKRTLSSIPKQLSAFHRDVRWVGDEQMHLTVKFLGDVPDDRVGEVENICRDSALDATPFELTVDRCGCFPPRGPVRVIWGGCSSTPDALASCVGECESGFQRIGFDREHRPYAPHLTVGRVKFDKSGRRLRDAISEVSFSPTSQTMNSLTLFRSTLTPAGAKYDALEQFSFGGDL